MRLLRIIAFILAAFILVRCGAVAMTFLLQTEEPPAGPIQIGNGNHMHTTTTSSVNNTTASSTSSEEPTIVTATEAIESESPIKTESPVKTESAPVTPMEVFLSEIESNMESLNENFTVSVAGLSKDDIDVDSIQEKFPQLRGFHLKEVFYTRYMEIEVTLNISMSYRIYTAYRTGQTERLSDMEKEVLDVVLSVIKNNIDPDMSDYEKELAIHDYITSICENDNRTDVPDESYTPYGVLILGSAVCEGYSNTFKLFMDMLGIECDIITGTAKAGGHAWNRVSIDGKYYLVDVTWDDPVTEPDADKRVNYDYFNLTDGVMNISHTPKKSQTKIANSTKYNYFYYNNLVVSSIDDFIAVISESLSKDQNYVYVRCKDIDLHEFVEGREIFKYLSGYTHITYSFNDDVNTLYLSYD